MRSASSRCLVRKSLPNRRAVGVRYSWPGEGQDQRSAAPFVSLDTQVVERTGHALPSLLKDVRVDHRR